MFKDIVQIAATVLAIFIGFQLGQKIGQKRTL